MVTIAGGDEQRSAENSRAEIERLRAQIANLSNLNRNLTEAVEKERRRAFEAENQSRERLSKAEALASALTGFTAAFGKGAR